MIGRGLNRSNQKLRTKIKEAREIKIDVEIRTGVQLYKIININSIGGCNKSSYKLRDQNAL